MSTIRNVVARLAPVRSLTSRLPKFSESLVKGPFISAESSSATPKSVSWPKYAADGQYTPVTDLLKSRPAARVIAIGEHHHQPKVLNLQLQVLEALSQKPDDTVLVVEYFNLTQARLLKRFSNGEINMPELASAYADSSEDFDIEGHLAPLLSLAKEKNVPIVAGFPPREWARDFLKDNGGVLSKLKDDFAFDRPEDTKSKDLGHDAYFESLLSGQAPRERVPDGESRKGARIMPAQLLKDAVMAWSIDQQLAKGKRVVVLAGLGHLEYGFGVMERVREAKREDMILIACKSNNESELWLHQEGSGGGSEGAALANRQATTTNTTTNSNDRAIADAVYLYDAV
jgi:Haem-binding uptake, Tiki superfamily, ChaN